MPGGAPRPLRFGDVSGNLDPNRRELWPVSGESEARVIKVKCPFCKGTLEVDAETGAVLEAREHNPRRKDFDDALGDVWEEKSRIEEDFSHAFDSEKQRAEVLEKKFRKAREHAKDEDQGSGNPLDDL